VAVIAFNWDRFHFDFWGQAGTGDNALGSVMDQVKSTMLVTLWVFIGIEGASVYSARAANRADVGRATLLGFAGALAIYVLVSLLARGLMTQPELAGLKVPSMAGVLEAAVGGWGAALINLGLIVSVGGAFLAWTLLCAEIPYVCGKDGTFPKWFAGENAAGSPVNSLWVTNGLIQLFLLVSYFSQNAYHFFYFIASVAILPPYVFSGAYALKLAHLGRDVRRGGQMPQSRHDRRWPRNDLRHLARLCGRPPISADVHGPVHPRHRRLCLGAPGARRARLHGRRGADCRGDRGACPGRRLVDVDRPHQPAVIR
jgi:arginine:ornithine antiporter/lysine permease